MRDINFRAWHKDIKEMFEVGQITLEKGIWDYQPENRKHIGISIPYQPSFILMQYTGLHDKNGKEIYEGDIVLIDKENNIKGIVKYSEVWAEFIVVNTNSIADECEPLGDYKENIEILGNEFDNPDLLEKGAEE